MKKSSIVIAVSLILSQAAVAAKTYQVTGTVLAITESTITVDKKGEKFEIEKTAATKLTGDLKQGGKVTVYYSMSAAEIETKSDTTTTKKSKK